MARASENRGIVNTAAEELRDAITAVNGAHSGVSETGVFANSSVGAIDRAMMSHTTAIRKIDDVLGNVRMVIMGSTHPGAVAAIMWLEEARRNLEDDLVKLRGMKDNIQKEIRKTEEILTNLNDTRVKVTGAVSQFAAYGNVL